jgi:hypothetical protein
VASLPSTLLLQERPESPSRLLGKLFPGARFHHLPLFQDHDIIRPADRGKPVGDNNHRQLPMKPLYSILNFSFVVRIKGAGCLIKDQDGRLS